MPWAQIDPAMYSKAFTGLGKANLGLPVVHVSTQATTKPAEKGLLQCPFHT